MITIRREAPTNVGGMQCLIWLDEPLPVSFPKDLLNELLALAQPVGLSVVAAYAMKKHPLTAVIDSEVIKAGNDHRGERNRNKTYNFDYVAGYRIKVHFYPEGVPIYEEDDETDPLFLQYQGLPLVTSIEFDRMYGNGALENAVRLAIL